ncbi:MAG TPA: dihydrofolate reductase family protein [Solirubrobacteraceae bacterium]|jgi:riboflavin-specific deaminase-like protein|nr:dihydrofolate reductase family protein [Solirubrobacteraceae bacterium]
MCAPADDAGTPASPPDAARAPARLTALRASGDALGASAFVDGLDLAAHGRAASPRPYVMLNMVSTVDGRASIDGRSGPLGNRADRELFHALRAAVDGVLVGAGTIRAERYGPIVRDAAVRRRRVDRGLSEQPLACIVSGRVSLPSDTPLLADERSHVVILTPSAASLTGARAQVDYVRAERDGALELPRALSELRERYGVRTLLCEGGPHLNAELLLAGVVDELFVSLSPMLAGGEGASGESLRIVAGAELDEPLELELLSALESDSHLFLRYAVASAPERA